MIWIQSKFPHLLYHYLANFRYIRHRLTLLRNDDLDKLCPDMSILTQTAAILDTPIEHPPLPQFVRPEPMMQQHILHQQHVERLQAAATAQARQQAYQLVAEATHQQQQQQQQQQHHPMQPPQMQQGQQRAPSDTSNGHASPAVNQGQGQGMLPPQSTGQNGRPPVIKRPSSQNGNHSNGGLPNVAIAQAQAQGQVRPSGSPTYNMQQGQQMSGSPQIPAGMMLPNGKPVIGPNGQMDPNMQRMLAARLHQQQQQQQHQDGSNPPQLNSAPSLGLAAVAQMTPEQQQQIAQLAAKGGFGDNIGAFLEQRNKAKQLAQANKLRNEQQAALAAQQAQAQGQATPAGNQRQASNGSNNGNGNGTPAPDPSFNSPQLPSGQLNLKLPAHATKRLGNNQTPSSPAQRAQ